MTDPGSLPTASRPRRVVCLSGGVGGAKLAHGLAMVAAESAGALELTVVVNTADDMELHALRISPDLDTVMYTLADVANPETGWGLRDETWSNAEMLARYGAPLWFRLGDRDLATHIVRTERLRRGQRLTEVTEQLAGAIGVSPRLLPMTDADVRTRLRTADGWLEFQEYFVRRAARDEVLEVSYEGAEEAATSPEVRDAIASADLIVIAPSNPFLSVGPMLALGDLFRALLAARAPIVAVSPIVGGEALKGPAADIFRSLGGEASALGVARHYLGTHPGLLDTLVIDSLDAQDAPRIEALGLGVVVTDTVMRDETGRRRLASELL